MNRGDIEQVPETDRAGPRAAGPDLTRLIPLETLQAMQDRFARMGQFSIFICDANGAPLTVPTWGSCYSEMIGMSRAGIDEWRDAVRAVAQSFDAAQPPVILEGMTLYRSAVVHGRDTVAVIVVGTRPLDDLDSAMIDRVARRYGLNAEHLAASLQTGEVWTGGTPDSIHRVADLLADTLVTLYDQADRINRQLADLRIVHGLAELLAGSSDLSRILDITVAQVAQAMSVKASAIRLLDESTGELVIRATHNLSANYVRKGPVMVDGNAIDAAAFRGETVYIEDVPNDPRVRYPDNARQEGIKSGLCVPMTFRGRTIGVLRVYTSERRQFSETERQLLRSIAAQAAAAVITSQLNESIARDERTRRQLESARVVQRRMLPAAPPRHPILEFGCVYEPSMHLSGDFFDFVECQHGALGVCIADVVGKGLPAALLMASVRSSMRAHAAPADTVADLVGRTNRDMCRDTMVSEFATMFFGLFSRDGSRFIYTNAGHVPPVLLRDNVVTPLDVGGSVIGIAAEEHYLDDTVALRAGDIIAMMTDGVTESFDFDDRAYGFDRAVRSLRRHQALPAPMMAQQLLWDVRRFVGLAEQSDDITIVVAKVRGG